MYGRLVSRDATRCGLFVLALCLLGAAEQQSYTPEDYRSIQAGDVERVRHLGLIVVTAEDNRLRIEAEGGRVLVVGNLDDYDRARILLNAIYGKDRSEEWVLEQLPPGKDRNERAARYIEKLRKASGKQ